ncbi:MAG: peptide ABC transporter substrate-binding protein [Lactobacillales bacterium]|nr:peptide ABC transporter substrate-binding protein [Lactobacillales bacterium]
MKKQKVLTGLATAAIVASTLAGCGSTAQKATEQVWKGTFSFDPTTFDYVSTYRGTNSQFFTNFIDGLVENDPNGHYIPALAKELPTVENGGISKDGLTYTFHIRKGAKWTTSEGDESYGDVKAQDFVYGLKRAVETKSTMLPVVEESIKGLEDYISGADTDFSHVGVKAIDDYTVEYTLEHQEPYFVTKFNYSILYPVNEKFATEKGDAFGDLKPENILYDGPFTLANFTSKSIIEIHKNDNYWDKKNVHVDKAIYTFDNELDPSSLYSQFKKGELTTAKVNANLPVYKQAEKENKDNLYLPPLSTGTTYTSFNFNRVPFEYTTPEHDAKSTQAALLNTDFRRALLFGLDRKGLTEQEYGKPIGAKPVRNELVPSDFVLINGGLYSDAVSKAAGEYLPEFKDANFADGTDAIHNVDAAKKYLEKAKKELGADIKWPIHLDVDASDKDNESISQTKFYKASLEKALGKENVVVDIHLLSTDQLEGLNGGIQNKDFDLGLGDGWGPDYADPITYLNIFRADNGDMLAEYGFEDGDAQADLKKQVGLDEYTELVKKANAITATDKLNERYEAFAKADAFLISHALIIPREAGNGLEPTLSYIKPFTQPSAAAGSTNGRRFKFTEIQSTPVTKEAYDKAQKEFNKKHAEQ